MSNFNLGDISAALTDLKGTGVSFLGKALKWESEKEAHDLIEAINNCKNLQYLNLEGNTLGVEAAKGIAKALEKHPELKEALWKDLFTGRMKTEIPKALIHLGEGMISANAQLSVLDCSDNALGPNGMTGLVDLLKSLTCFTLQDLKLNNCGLGIGGGKMLSKALLQCHAESSKIGKPLSLKIFIAGRNRLENDGATALSEVFAACKTLERIEMPQNGIYHVGITALSEAFKENIHLKILNLNDNTIGPKGASALADAFMDCQELREINFGDCLLKTRGTCVLAEALQDGHVELEVLNLGFNEIGPDGGFSIVNATYNKSKLETLILDGNHFGYECREQMRETLEEYERLEALTSLSEDDSEGEDDEEGSDEDDEDDGESGDGEDDTEKDESDEADEAEHYIQEHENKNENEDEIQTSLKEGESINLDDTLPNTVESYCHTHFPSETMFLALEEKDKISAFRDYLKKLSNEDYLVYLVFTILKCSELSEKHKEALELSEALYKDAFEYAKNNNRVKSLRNFFLIQLNLLKCEDSKFKPSYDVKACRFALRNAIDKNVVPVDEQNSFKVFLDQQTDK